MGFMTSCDKMCSRNAMTFKPKSRYSTRTRLLSLLFFLIGFCQLVSIVNLRLSFQKSKLKQVQHGERNEIYKEHMKEFKGTDMQLVDTVKSGFGRLLIIEYVVSKGETQEDMEIKLSFQYAQPYFPRKIEESKLQTSNNTKQKPAGYVQVYGRYWEQMTMNTRCFLSLVGQAKIGARSVVQPMVKDSSFGRQGHSLGLYFNMTHVNNMLLTNNYASLVEKKEFDAACSLANSSHVNVHFLYSGNGVKYTKSTFQLSNHDYERIRERARTYGWTECPFIGKVLKQNSNARNYCVAPSVVAEWDRLEREVVRGAKCLTVMLWRGIGGSYRTYFKETHLMVSARDMQFALKPAQGIVLEVDIFKKAFLSGPYIAVHVRGEKVVIPHDLQRLRKCLSLLIQVVQALRRSSDITQVFIATDMTNMGSGSWKGSLKDETDDDTIIRGLHNELISYTGGTVYKPSAENHDRGVVALVEMTLISQAQHLITVGEGSFQEWVVAKFLEHHRDNDKQTWSLISMCSK